MKFIARWKRSCSLYIFINVQKMQTSKNIFSSLSQKRVHVCDALISNMYFSLYIDAVLQGGLELSKVETLIIKILYKLASED